MFFIIPKQKNDLLLRNLTYSLTGSLLDQTMIMAYHSKMSQKDTRHGFLKRFLYTYLAVLIIPLILLNFFVFRLILDHSRELEKNYMSEYLGRIQRDLEGEMNRMEIISRQINESLLIRSSVMEGNYEKYQEASTILRAYKDANQFISDIIYYPRDGLTLYGTSSVYSFDTYTKYFLAIPGVTQYKVFRKLNAVRVPGIINWNDEMRPVKSLNFHYVYPLEKTTDRDASLIFLISYANMSRLLGIDKDPPESALFLTDSQDRIIFEYTPPDWSGAADLFLSALSSGSPLSPGSDYSLVVTGLNDPDWKLTVMVQNEAHLLSVKKALTLTALISLAVLLLEFLIIRFSLSLTYNPLKNLAEYLTPEEPVDNVLHSLQEGVHKLQETQESALNKLQREDFIGTLLHISPTDDTDLLLQNKATILGFEGKGREMAALIIDMGDLSLAGDSELTDAYYETLTDLVPFPLLGWFEPVANRLFCVIYCEGKSKGEIKENMDEACEQLFEEFSLEGRISLGSIKTDFSHLRDSMDEAFINLSSLTRKEREEISFYEESLEEFKQSLAARDNNKALSLVSDFYEKAPSPEINAYLTFRLFSILTNSLPGPSQEIWRSQKDFYLEQLSEEERKDLLLKLTGEAVNLLKHISEQSSLKSDLLDEITAYIDKNYLSPEFSVSRVADHFEMSLSGVSLLFKRHRGYGIAAYVGNARIGKARELLREGHSVNQVVLAVGYRDTTSFIKKFKKVTGQTPGEYTAARLG